MPATFKSKTLTGSCQPKPECLWPRLRVGAFQWRREGGLPVQQSFQANAAAVGGLMAQSRRSESADGRQKIARKPSLAFVSERGSLETLSASNSD